MRSRRAQPRRQIPHDIASRHGALPIAYDGNRIVVAMAQPQNLLAIDELQFRNELQFF
jgi:hypothetical protein